MVADPDLHAGDRAAGRRRHGHRVVVGAAHRHHDGLGLAVGGDDGVVAEFGLHALDENDGHRGGAGDRDAQARQVVLVAGREVEDRLVDASGRPAAR